MQKGERNKLKLLLTGIRARLEQNREYFVGVRYTFRAGKKKFEGSLSLQEDGYTLRFQGADRVVDAAGAVEFFEEQAGKYEEACLEYTERGAARR